MSDQKENHVESSVPYKLGVEAGKTLEVLDETTYTTTDGQSTFPIESIAFTVPGIEEGSFEYDKLVRCGEFIKGLFDGRGEQPVQEVAQ